MLEIVPEERLDFSITLSYWEFPVYRTKAKAIEWSKTWLDTLPGLACQLSANPKENLAISSLRRPATGSSRTRGPRSSEQTSIIVKVGSGLRLPAPSMGRRQLHSHPQYPSCTSSRGVRTQANKSKRI